MSDCYDLVVIGAGPGGYPAALAAARLGKSVAVIEKGSIGGTCLCSGCIPMKTLLHTSQLYREIKASAQTGLYADSVSVDISMLQQRRKQVIETLSSGILMQFKKAGVRLYQGTALITAAGKVLVTGTDGTGVTLDCRNILIAAGSEPAVIPVPGLGLPGIENSTTLLERPELYKSLTIIGGGVIGMEFASFYTDMGIHVTVLEALDHILPNMDREIAQNLKMILAKRGADIHASAKVSGVEKTADGLFSCTYTENSTEKNVLSEGLLVATGRRPCGSQVCSPGVAAALEIVKGRIPVNERYETAVPGIYASGDVTGGIQLAHAATAAALNAVAGMFGQPPAKNTDLIPSCVYTDPEIACIGMTADEAEKSGHPVSAGKYIMSVNGKSVLSLQERGFIKITADSGTGAVLGAQLMCARATDMIATLELAVARGCTVLELASLIFPHPTFCEGITEAAESCRI